MINNKTGDYELYLSTLRIDLSAIPTILSEESK